MTPDPEPNHSPDPVDAAAGDAKAKDPPDSQSADMSSDASFWSESQVQEVIRHAGQSGRSPEEFFNKKWKEKLIHHKGEDDIAANDVAPPQE